MPHGTPLSGVHAAVARANPSARLVEISAPDLRRLCPWLGSTDANRRFNALQRYVLHESSRYCAREDHDERVANVPNWNWRNPFTAFNCTWGFAPPADYPEPSGAAATEWLEQCARGAPRAGVQERESSMTCARAMLCDVHVEPDGRLSKPVEKASRCNLEGYGGVDYDTYGKQIEAALSAMPGGRCPVPPGASRAGAGVRRGRALRRPRAHPRQRVAQGKPVPDRGRRHAVVTT